jgi:hypothetical protein
MGDINFYIGSGAAPFVAELLGSDKPDQTLTTIGAYQFVDVENGVYTLRITDGNGCVDENEVIVDPFVTTTTTTVIPGSSIVVGHTQDPVTIFNPDATNRNSEYEGFPDPDVVVLYLWFKTLDGTPLNALKQFDYTFSVTGISGTSQFTFTSVSDEIHCEVQESATGPTEPLTGTIILKENFIESYFEYVYYRGSTDKRYKIELVSAQEIFDPLMVTRDDDSKLYGIGDVDRNQVKLYY